MMEVKERIDRISIRKGSCAALSPAWRHMHYVRHRTDRATPCRYAVPKLSILANGDCAMGSMSLVAARNSTAEKFASLAPSAPSVMTALAAKAGFRFNGDDPWDVRVSDQRLYRRILVEGSLGF